MSKAKFEYFKEWAGKISSGFNEMKEDNDLFYDSMFEIMDRLDADLASIKSRPDKANI